MEKSLKIANKKRVAGVLLLLLICQFVSCKKMSVSQNSATFFKTYPTDSAASSVFLEQLNDGSFIIVSSEGSGRPLITKTDRYGNFIWAKTIQKYYLSMVKFFNVFSTQNAGLLVGQADGMFTIFDTSGDIVHTINLSSNSTNFAAMIPFGSDFVVSSCSGRITAPPSANNIYVLGQDLTQKNLFNFTDTRIGGTTLDFFVNTITPAGDYIIAGDKFPLNNGLSLNFKLFVARIPVAGKVIETIIDSSDQTHSDFLIQQISTNDSGMVLLSQRADNVSNISYPVVIKVDKNLKVSEKEFKVNYGSVPSKISPCRDGGFIISGSIFNTGFNPTLGFVNYQPYAFKIDSNGNQQWGKTFSSNEGIGSFYSGIELNDGSFAFVGSTSQFGNRLNGTRILFVKTNANGNL